MSEHTPYQKKVIERYYENRDEIMLARLGDIVSDLYLADTEARTRRLWERVAKAMASLGVPATIADHILSRRDPEVLARNLKGWIAKATEPPGGNRG